jgi:hypothetical protein
VGVVGKEWNEDSPQVEILPSDGLDMDPILDKDGGFFGRVSHATMHHGASAEEKGEEEE